MVMKGDKVWTLRCNYEYHMEIDTIHATKEGAEAEATERRLKAPEYEYEVDEVEVEA